MTFWGKQKQKQKNTLKVGLKGVIIIEHKLMLRSIVEQQFVYISKQPFRSTVRRRIRSLSIFSYIVTRDNMIFQGAISSNDSYSKQSFLLFFFPDTSIDLRDREMTFPE